MHSSHYVPLFFFLVHFLPPALPSKLANLASDQSALLAFKHHVNPQTILSHNWTASAPVCNWVGVSCSPRHGRITALELPDLCLQGTIPPNLENLSFLVSLNLSNNSFHGHLPKELTRLRRLKFLDLSFNHLSGEIPSDFGDLPKIQSLFLRNNSLTGTIPASLFNISTLESLSLSYNSIQGKIPSKISEHPNMKILDLGNNKLSGSIPSAIFNVSSVKYMDLSSNMLSGKLPDGMCDSLPKLEFLSVSDNKLDGQIPPSLGRCGKLEILGLSINRFTGKIPRNVGNLTKLKELYLGDTNLEGEIPQEIGKLLNLEIFAAESTRGLTGSIPPSFFNISSFIEISFQNNSLSGEIPNEVGNLQNLQYLNIGENQLVGHIPAGIFNISTMTFLYLQNNFLSGSLPSTIGLGLPNLEEIFLWENSLTGIIPESISNASVLTILDLAQNSFSGEIPTCLSSMDSLRYLYLDSNNFNSSIPISLWSLTFILEVNLSSNYLTGPLSVDAGNLKVMTEFDLSRNHISGNIPSSIGALKDLSYLSLANNGFQGPIPRSFGNLISLEFLDLSSNKLSGVIPKSLEALSSLKEFNVSANRLEGEIPSGGPFRNFSQQSFLHNYGLCGLPRLRVPPCKTAGSLEGSKKATSAVLKYILPVISSVILLVLVAFVVIVTRSRKQVDVPDQGSSLRRATWRRISYIELRRATDGFSESNLLGMGSFGSVYKGELSNGTTDTVAVKVFNLQFEGAFKSFDVETDIMRKICHRNLVKIISCCCSGDFKALVLEFMPNRSLESWLYSPDRGLNILERLNIMIDVASALEYLHHGHSTPIVHCDLKPSNVLLDKDMVAHVSDFGIAKLLGGEESIRQTLTLATIGYMAPEYGTMGMVSTKCDIYSFGILLMETFTRKKPTDEMFAGELNLRSWVEMSISIADKTSCDVMDACLLQENEKHLEARIECMCLVLRLALDCSAESAEDRENMTEVLAALKKIRQRFQKNTGRRR
ncbi:LRR receptor-like serine/threonine-protein kinase FLS2 isoform X2 [Carica papaya]|uniref:LRR receptor-like serine/threonine-protein kinase FLS2 isoform X2 n=1 Tax=Carica papaya TaxID=3649 RepID=UPI000B8CD8AA|nr:LRR receptor-like serine/threonine-protein kinase FLS2 isoform X2 [Carica papaya]